jgi:hypothetical protein
MPSSDPNAVRPLPQDLRRFIEQHLRSSIEVELLLLLSRSAETFWSASAAAAVIGADTRDTRAHLTRFMAAGLVERSKQTEAFRFAPATPERRSAVASLSEYWSTSREEVLRAIWGSIAQITAFADAFRFPGK